MNLYQQISYRIRLSLNITFLLVRLFKVLIGIIIYYLLLAVLCVWIFLIVINILDQTRIGIEIDQFKIEAYKGSKN